MVFLSLIIAFISLAYASYLHVYYKGERYNYLKTRIKEELKFLENCKILNIEAEDYLRTCSLADLISKNNKMEKEIKKYKLNK